MSSQPVSGHKTSRPKPLFFPTRVITRSAAELHEVFPVLPSSALRLEFLLSSSTLDLEAISSTVRDDPGLVVALLMSGCSGADVPQADWGVQDCIIELGRRGMLRLLAAVPVAVGPGARVLGQIVERSRRVARAAQAIASALDIDPEGSYLHGLLHYQMKHVPAHFPFLDALHLAAASRALDRVMSRSTSATELTMRRKAVETAVLWFEQCFGCSRRSYLTQLSPRFLDEKLQELEPSKRYDVAAHLSALEFHNNEAPFIVFPDLSGSRLLAGG